MKAKKEETVVKTGSNILPKAKEYHFRQRYSQYHNISPVKQTFPDKPVNTRLLKKQSTRERQKRFVLLPFLKVLKKKY